MKAMYFISFCQFSHFMYYFVGQCLYIHYSNEVIRCTVFLSSFFLDCSVTQIFIKYHKEDVYHFNLYTCISHHCRLAVYQ